MTLSVDPEVLTTAGSRAGSGVPSQSMQMPHLGIGRAQMEQVTPTMPWDALAPVEPKLPSLLLRESVSVGFCVKGAWQWRQRIVTGSIDGSSLLGRGVVLRFM